MHIIHTSIPAHNPKRAAEALSRLFGGAVYKFLHPGCYFVLLGEPGALIELYRKEIELRPGQQVGQPCQLLDCENPPQYCGSHTAVRVGVDTEQVLAIAAEYGWRAEVHRRKIFRVIEFWIENEYLLEVFTPELHREYMAACAMLSHVNAESATGAS